MSLRPPFSVLGSLVAEITLLRLARPVYPRTAELRKTLLPRHLVIKPRPGGSSSKASEFLLQERVVVRACLLAFQPLHVVLNPRVVAFFRKAREGVRRNEVHQSLLGALPEHAHLPILSLLLVMLTVCQLPKLLASLGAGDGLKGALEEFSGLGDHGLRLALKDFLSHLVHRLFGSHGLLSPSLITPASRRRLTHGNSARSAGSRPWSRRRAGSNPALCVTALRHVTIASYCRRTQSATTGLANRWRAPPRYQALVVGVSAK